MFRFVVHFETYATIKITKIQLRFLIKRIRIKKYAQKREAQQTAPPGAARKVLYRKKRGFSIVKGFINDLRREFSGYNAAKLTKDLMAGITVTAVALPLALAFGVSSGADAAAGLITAILAGLIIGFFSGASYQISGPTGAMAAILVSVVASYGLQGVFLATLMAGIILVVAGLFKIGRLVSVIPMPVITGFTSGIAIIIALGQLDNFFGTTSAMSGNLGKLFSYFVNGFHPDWKTTAIGLFVVAFMILWPKKWQAVFPSSLAALIVVLILNAFLKWDVAVVGAIPRTLLPEARLSLGGISLDQLTGLIAPAFSIAALGMIESLLCGASAGNMKGEPLNADRELIAQGIGNIVIPFFGGVPATAAIARTSVAIKAGQQTRLTGIVHSVGLLASMFLLSGIMSQIPMAALAGVLMVTAWRMNEWHTIRYLFRHRLKSALLAFLVTLVCTVVFDLSIAIVAGVALCCVLFAVKCVNNVEVIISEVDPLRLEKLNQTYHQRHAAVRVVYISGSIFFGSAGYLTTALSQVPEEMSAVILSVRGVSTVDSTGIQAFLHFCQEQRDRGTAVCFAGASAGFRAAMDRGGVTEVVGEDAYFWGAQEALAAIAEETFAL